MQHDKLYKEITRLGITIDLICPKKAYYIAKGSKYLISWYKREEEAECVHLVSHKQEGDRDINSDYFPGFFPRSYKAVKHYLTLQD
jgi:hypothetical protein